MIKVFDSHIHSDCSPDSSEEIATIIKTAIDLGLYGIAITDHWDVGTDENDFKKNIERSTALTRAFKKQFENRLKISVGIELGQPHLNKDELKSAYMLTDYDYINISNHDLDSHSDIPFNQCDEKSIIPLLSSYYKTLREIASDYDFDSLAHMTYPLRYTASINHIQVNMSRLEMEIDNVLEVLVRRKKALEINTSGYRQAYGDSFPNYDIVKRYHQMGGRLVTIGSDSHSADTIGDGFELAAQMLRRAGFEGYCYYQNRKPVKIDF